MPDLWERPTVKGWELVHASDARWEAGQREGKVHPWERSRILRGDFSPILREREPAFTEGDIHVLSWSQPRGALVRDRTTGEEIVYPKPPPQPLFRITIRDVVRHKSGYWRVRFHVDDYRDVTYLVRRRPPALSLDEEGTTEEEAALESGYTKNPRQAVDHLSAVPAEYQNVLSMQAHSRFADHRREIAEARENERDLQRVQAELRELVKRGAKIGIPASVILAPIARTISAHHDDLSQGEATNHAA